VTRRFPPGPDASWFGFQQAAAMRRDLIGFCSRLQSDYGDAAHFRLGPFNCFQFTHPEQVTEVLVRKANAFRKQTRLKQVFGRFEGNGLVVSDGEHWARQRRLVQPAFAPARMEEYAGIVSEAAARMLDRWEREESIDIGDEMRRLMLQIVTRTLFSADLDDAAAEIASAVDVIQGWSMREMHRIVATPSWLPLWGAPEANRAIALLHSQVQRIVAQRRAAPDAQDDLLGRLLQAVDAEGGGRQMTNRELQDELVTLLLAGHETSAAAATWTALLLATHSEIQENIAAAARQTLSNRAPTFADLAALAPVEQAFKESMRLYPPVYFLSREAAESLSGPVRAAVSDAVLQ
jgi:cytochrome P450